MNHSCDPNATVVFDGPKLSLRALTDILKGDEITITYIDPSYPFHRRQDLLKHRYFFTCACQKCQLGSTLREDRFTDDGKVIVPDLFDLEKSMFEILEAAEKAADTGGHPLPCIKMLEEAMNTMKRASWSIHRQPWPSMRHLLIIQYLSAAEWTKALAHMLKTYLYIDPVIYPQSWHPVRVVNAWILTQHVVHLASLSASQPLPLAQLDRYRIRYATVALGLAMEVETNVSRSHGAETKFAQEVRRTVQEIKAVTNEKSLLPEQDRNINAEEWLKLQAIANSADVNA